MATGTFSGAVRAVAGPLHIGGTGIVIEPDPDDPNAPATPDGFFLGLIDDLSVRDRLPLPPRTTADTSGRDRHARLLGDARLVDEGRFEKALLLDGDGDGAEAAGLPALAARDFRLEAWVRPQLLDGERVVASRWGEAGGRSFKLALVDGVPVFCWTTDGLTVQSLASAQTLAVGVWARVVVTREGAALRLRVDEHAAETATLAGAVFDSQVPLRIGGAVDADGGWFAGLLDEVRVSVAPEPVGTPGERVYQYNAANQLVRETGFGFVNRYRYDANGNNILIERADALGQALGSTAMQYDALNRMTRWEAQNAAGVAQAVETHAYRGAEWHRASTTVIDGANPAATTNYLYDGDNVVADMVGGSYSRLYVTPFLDQNLGMYDVADAQDPAAYYYSQDGLGSVRTVTDAAGVLKNSYDYTAFGEPYAQNTVKTVENRYTYTGREASSVGAPMYYRYRMYDAGVGRFTARDPWLYFGSPEGNLFTYVGNRPNKFTDAYGLTTPECGWISNDMKEAFGQFAIPGAGAGWQILTDDDSYIDYYGKGWINHGAVGIQFNAHVEIDDWIFNHAVGKGTYRSSFAAFKCTGSPQKDQPCRIEKSDPWVHRGENRDGVWINISADVTVDGDTLKVGVTYTIGFNHSASTGGSMGLSHQGVGLGFSSTSSYGGNSFSDSFTLVAKCGCTEGP